MTKYFPAQTGTLILSLDLAESGLGTWSRILLSDGSANAIEIYNSDLYDLCYRANDGSYVNFLTPTPGSWYELVLAVDVQAKRFDIYVGGTRVKTACTFRNVVSSISQIKLATGESYTGTTRFKDISIRKGIS